MNDPARIVGHCASGFRSFFDRSELIGVGTLAFVAAKRRYPGLPDDAFFKWVRGAMLQAVYRWNKTRTVKHTITLSIDTGHFSQADQRAARSEMFRRMRSNTVNADARVAIGRAVDALSPTLRRIVRQHYYDDLPLGAIAIGMKMRHQHVRVLRDRALDQLRSVLRDLDPLAARARATRALYAERAERERQRPISLRREGQDRGATARRYFCHRR